MDTLLQIGLSNAVAATVLALVAACAGHFCRRPALVHSLWLLVLLKLVTPPLWMMPILPAVAPEQAERTAPRSEIRREQPAVPEPAPLRAGHPRPLEPGSELDRTVGFSPEQGLSPDPQVSSSQPAPAPPQAQWSWGPLVAAGWLAGCAVWLAVTVVRVRRFQRLLRYARPASAELCRQAEQVAARLGIRRCPGVWLVPGPISPMLWALGRPARLLLPAALWEQLSDEQRRTLLAHELAHYRRRDHWVRGLELLATGLYWWHPVVWWGRHELRQAEEECCDAWVVWALPEAARAYATALLETVTFLTDARAALPPAVSGVGHVRILKRRLTMIMRATTPRALSWAGCLTVLGLGTLLLPWLPTQAKSEPPPAEQANRADSSSPDAAVKVVHDKLLEEQVCMSCHAAWPKEDVVLNKHDEIVRLAKQMQEQRRSLSQAEAKLRQAQQRLAETEKLLENALERFGYHPSENPKQSSAPKARDTSWAAKMFKQTHTDFGTVRHGQQLNCIFRMENPWTIPAHIASIRTTCGCVTATAQAVDLAPKQESRIQVIMDTRRFTGIKTASIYVTVDFGGYGSHEFHLTVRADVRDDAGPLLQKPAENGPKTEGPQNQRRMQDLEKKLDDLRREIQELRRQQKAPSLVLPPEQQPAQPPQPYKVIPLPHGGEPLFDKPPEDKYQAPTVPLGKREAAKLFELAQFYQRTGHPESARSQYEILRERYPDSKLAEKAAVILKQTQGERKEKTGGR